jgi:hypothetical protein
MKCYSLIDVSDEQLVNYFNVTYCSIKEPTPIILKNPINWLPYNSRFSHRHEVINSLTKPEDKYLEIGVEYGYTYSNTHFLVKTGVDPDPKCSYPNIEKCLSDEFFLLINERKDLTLGKDLGKDLTLVKNLGKDLTLGKDLGKDLTLVKNLGKNLTLAKDKYDVIFIDGMHHSENVLRDFNNSVNVLSTNGFLFLDDILPLNYNEQLKVPRLHHYENGILKYGEEWTGDVWKVVYHLLTKYSGNINFGYYYNINYRGVLFINIKEYFQILDEEIKEISKYDYFEHFNHYLSLLQKK